MTDKHCANPTCGKPIMRNRAGKRYCSFACRKATATKPIPLEEFREEWARQFTPESKITTSALKVANAATWHINRETRQAFPSILTLAAETGLSPRTVIRAIHWLEAHGHLDVKRTQIGRRKLVNQYIPNIPAHKPVSLGSDKLSQGSDKLVSLGSDKLVSHEPLTEPLIPISISEAAGAASQIELKNSSKGKGHSGQNDNFPEPTFAPGSPLTLKSQCYELGRNKFGLLGPPLITKAINNGIAEDEILSETREAETADELAYALWRP